MFLEIGDRVRLPADEENPEEFGTIIDICDRSHTVCVVLENQYLDRSLKFVVDDGVRECPYDEVEKVDERCF